MKRVLFTGTGPEHKYVANRIAREVSLAAVIVDNGQRQIRRQRAYRLLRRYSPLQLAGRAAWPNRLYCLAGRARTHASVHRILGPDAVEFRFPHLLRQVEGINSPGGRSSIRDFDLDQILIYGTGIVGPNILRLSRLPALNMHTGISPHYRGSACAF